MLSLQISLAHGYVSCKKSFHLWPASGVGAGPRVYRAPARVTWPAPRVAPWVAPTFPRTIETLLAGVAARRRIIVGPAVVVVIVIAYIVVVIVDLEPRPAVRRAVAGLPRLEPGWERLQGQGHHDQVEDKDDDEAHHDRGEDH